MENETFVNDVVNNEEFVNEDNVNAFKLLNLKSKVNDINAIMENISNEQKKVIESDIEFDFIDKNVDNYTVEEIKELSAEDIDKILTDEDGNLVEFTLDFNGNIDKLNEFKKEFLVLRKQSLETFKKFDEELAEINAEIAESQEEFDKLVNQFGNISNLIRSRLETKLNESETDEQKELIKKLIESFDCGFNLNNIKKYCKSPLGNNIIGDYRDDKRSSYIYRRYLKVVKKFDIKTDLTKFTNLEKRFLPVEFQNRSNIFVFAVIHYISSWHNKDYTKADGLFITQFTVNLKNLYYNKFESDTEKNEFINSIKEIIDIIG